MVFWHMTWVIPPEDHFAEYGQIDSWMYLRNCVQSIGHPGPIDVGVRITRHRHTGDFEMLFGGLLIVKKRFEPGCHYTIPFVFYALVTR